MSAPRVTGDRLLVPGETCWRLEHAEQFAFIVDAADYFRHTKAAMLRANNFGGNVHTFTGTPITNTLTEIFHQMRYVMEDEMKAVGVESWDGWFGSFAKEVQDVELSAAGEYEAINRLAGFINVPELRRMIGQYMDVVFADDMPEMQPRKVNGKTLTSADLTEAERAELLNGRTESAADRPYKKVVNVTSDLTDEQSRIFSQLQG